jgi:hypothetical protein
MRVTRSDLESKVIGLARLTGRDLRLSGAYGGWTVEDTVTGANVVSQCHIKAGELSRMIAVYVDGYTAAKQIYKTGNVIYD